MTTKAGSESSDSRVTVLFQCNRNVYQLFHLRQITFLTSWSEINAKTKKTKQIWGNTVCKKLPLDKKDTKCLKNITTN